MLSSATVVSPSVLGIGIDLMDVPRIRRTVAREGRDFLREFLRSSEIDRCRRTRYPLAAAAAAFAVKEAFFKALGTGRSGKISWHDVEIFGLEGNGRRTPFLKLSGETARIARKLGMTATRLALSWPGMDAGVTAATVVLEGTGTAQGCGGWHRKDCV